MISIDPSSSSSAKGAEVHASNVVVSPKSTNTPSYSYSGAYFAVLPSLPTIPPSELLRVCHELRLRPSMEHLVAWTHHRICQLHHPQLSEPLKYIEISAKLLRRKNISYDHEDHDDDDDDDDERTAANIVEALLEQSSIVGNAELLLILPNTPIPLLNCDLSLQQHHSQQQEIDDRDKKHVVSLAADRFDTFGLTLLSNAIESLDQIDALYDYALHEFERLYAAAGNATAAINADVSISRQKQNSNKFHYREIMSRDDYRYDFRLDLPQPQQADVEDASTSTCWKDVEANGGWKDLVLELLGTDYSLVKCGCVLSLPSCGIQYWHSDGTHVGPTADFSNLTTDSTTATSTTTAAAPPHALCVFVPLLDLSEETGCTEFWAGSHHYNKLLQKKGKQALPGGTFGYMKKGDALLYDYRTIHRGTGNISHTARPVCYFLYTKAGYETVEDQNFAPQSVFET